MKANLEDSFPEFTTEHLELMKSLSALNKIRISQPPLDHVPYTIAYKVGSSTTLAKIVTCSTTANTIPSPTSTPQQPQYAHGATIEGLGRPTRVLYQQYFQTLNPIKEKERIERSQKAMEDRERARRARHTKDAMAQRLAASNDEENMKGAPQPSTSPFAAYWQWLQQNGIEHAPLQIMAGSLTSDPRRGGTPSPLGELRGLYADADIPEGSVVATIPFRACLSPVTFPPNVAARHLNVPPLDYLLQAMNRKRKVVYVNRPSREQEKSFKKVRKVVQYVPVAKGDETNMLEVQHMWLACVIAAIKHKSARQEANRIAPSSPSLPYEPLIAMFPTTTADFSIGVKNSWPKLSVQEKRDFLAIADGHEAMVRKLHKVWLRWIKRTGRDALEDDAAARGGGELDEDDTIDTSNAAQKGKSDRNDEDDCDEDPEAELVVNKEGDVIGTLLGPHANKAQGSNAAANHSSSSTPASLSVAEEVSCSLTELRWAFRMVLSRATIVPSLCEPSAPEDLSTFLAAQEDDEQHAAGTFAKNGGKSQRTSVSTVPCIIPLVDLINHSPATTNASSSSTTKELFTANCEVMTARRQAALEDLEHIPEGLLAYLTRAEAKAKEKEKELQRQVQSSEAQSAGGEGEVSTSPTRDFTSMPQEVEADLIDRGVVVLLAVQTIQKSTPVLLEYDLTDKPASLMKYGFV